MPIMNNTLFLENLAAGMKANSLNPQGLLFLDYRKDLNIEQEKQVEAIILAAKKRTMELQGHFPTMLGIDRRRLHTEWLANIINRGERIGTRIPV